MMLRSKKNLANISGVHAKRKMGRNRKILNRTLSEVHIEGKIAKKFDRSVLHSGNSFCVTLSNCGCILDGEQPSSVAEHSATCQAKNSLATEVGKYSISAVPSSTSSPQVLPNSNQSADSQQSSAPENCAVVPSGNGSPQMLSNSTQTIDLLPSSVSEDSVRSLEMEDSIVEVIPIDISDVSVLETKSREPSSNSNQSADADTSDVIIISDSPGKGSVGNTASKTTSNEVSQLQGRKRKISDESGVEILCDILGPTLKKQRKMGCAIEEKKLWTNNTIKKNFTVAVSDTDRKISQLTNIEKSKGVNDNNTSEQCSGDGDDIIVIGADDDEVSIINTKEEHKPPQEDVIILDSPPVCTDKKPKKLVSASVTGLIPHYTQHLIDYISLDGKPPATISSSSTSTPQLPAGSRDSEVVDQQTPVVKKARSPRRPRQRRHHKAALKERLLNARNSNHTVQSHFFSVPVFTYPPPALTENRISAVINSATQNSSTQNSSTQNSSTQNSTTQNSATQNSATQNSSTQNSSTQNSSIQNSMTQNLTTQNSTTQNVAPENSVPSAPEVSQSPACTYGTNIYNPNAGDKEEDGLRPIIIDGNNIALGHGKGKCFSWRGLHICIKYFLKRGHKVTAFVPTFRRGVCPPELRSEMDEYERNGQVVFTPSRRIEGRLIVPYDDRFIVQCAAELGGVIVSTDNFRDLLSENSTWKETIEKRLLMFSWVGDLLMFPHDPLGRNGPKLEEFLRFPKK